MFDFKVDERGFEALMKSRRGKFATELDKALDTIRERWRRQLTTQQRNYRQSGWPKLKESYAEEKREKYPGTPILTRTGQMMRGYIREVQVDPQQGSVTLNWPGPEGTDVYIRAQAHQGVTAQPKGMPVRPFRFGPFEEIARQEFDRAIKKALK